MVTGWDLQLHVFLPLQVSLICFLVLEMVLGLGSNLTVLILYCIKQNLISSVSNIITVNLHVVDVLVSPSNTVAAGDGI